MASNAVAEKAEKFDLVFLGAYDSGIVPGRRNLHGLR